MIKTTKTYKVGDQDIKCEIVFGFDSDLLVNFPNEDNHTLFMFIPKDEYKEGWFKKHDNKNEHFDQSFTVNENVKIT